MRSPTSTAAGATGPGGDQRPALCRLRHHERQRRRAVHEHARPADGHAPRPGSGQRRRWRRPAISMPARAGSVERLGELRWAAWARCWATAMPARSPTTSAARRRAWTLASTRASWSASASATRHGTKWVNGFVGQGWTDTCQRRGLWRASARAGGFYVDALAGYAYYSNQLQRQIRYPACSRAPPAGSTGANQFLGSGRDRLQLGIYAPA